MSLVSQISDVVTQIGAKLKGLDARIAALEAGAPAAMTLAGTIPAGSAGGAVDAHLTLGGAFTAPVAISGLPAWLSAAVSGTDVHVTGTYPSTAGTYPFTVTATDSSATPQTANAAQSVDVSAAAPSTLTTSPTVSVSDTTARVSFRTSAASTVSIKYSTASDLSGGTTTGGVAVDSSTDFTGKIDLSGLPNATQHYYTVLVNGVDQITAPYPKFKTFPAKGSAATFSFAFGSCTDQSSGDTAFDAVPSDAAFLMHLGDTAYQTGTGTVDDCRTLQRAHLAASGSLYTGFRALRARTPLFTMWDDWDIKNDFSGGTSDPQYAPAFTAFSEYSGKANPDSPTSGALYYSFQVGDVGFFVPDERSYRSSNLSTDDSSKTLLGATQLAILKDWLLTNNNALKVKFICSETPVSGYGMTGGDSWGGTDLGDQLPHSNVGFRTERNGLWDFIDANKITGVVFLAGDQHWAAAFKVMYGAVDARPRYEFMATPFNQSTNGMTSLAADPVNGPILWKYNAAVNFGVVTVDTTVTPATVSFQLYGKTGSLGSSYLTEVTQDDIDAGLTVSSAMTLTGTLPNATVGAAYTGTLTLGGTFTAPVTIDASTGSIPSWMTPSVSGNVVTFSGTAPASVETDTFTVRATDSSTTPQVATSDQVVEVAAAGSGIRVVQAKAVNAVTANAAYLEATLDTPPAPGNHLVWLLMKGHTEYAVTFGSGTWTEAPAMPQASNNVGVDAFIREAVAGDGVTHRINFATPFSAAAMLVEVEGGTGTITGMTYNVTATAFPIALTIPGGVAGALPIMWEGAYGSTSAGTGTPAATAGWTLHANVVSTASGAACPAAVYSRDTLSDGSDIAVSASMTSANDRPRAAAFLLS